MKQYGTLGLVGRFKPLHNGGASLLEAACESAERVIIGIGSCNQYGVRNPFTSRETKEMIDAHLGQRWSNYEVIFLDDYGHVPAYSDGQRWRQEVLAAYGGLDGKSDAFISGNAYVRELLKEDYELIRPQEIIPAKKQVHGLCATDVRKAMAQGDTWEELVPAAVANYLKQQHLVERFRSEYGAATLADAMNAATAVANAATAEEERRRITR